MALNVARQLRFHRGFLPSRYHGTQKFRHFCNTSQKRALDEVLGEGIEKPKGMRVLERLGTLETEVASIKGSIGDGFKRIEGWIKTIVTFGVGTVTVGLGTLGYKVMIYDVATNREMKADIGKAITASEQKTEKAITASEQKTTAELDNLKLSIELTIQRQISEVLQEIRSVVRDEVYIRARDGEK